ncbi:MULTISPECIES: DUF4235 domain-containing protein [unclassified Modestobacter]
MAKKQKAPKPPKPPLLYKLLGASLAIPAGILSRKLITAAWSKTRGGPPPKNPAAPGVSWGDALGWAAVSGVMVALGRLLGNRGATALYQKLTGELPPGINAGSA